MFTSITFQEAYGLRVPNWSWGMHIHRSGKWDTTIAHSSQDALKKAILLAIILHNKTKIETITNTEFKNHKIAKKKKKKHVGLLEVK